MSWFFVCVWLDSHTETLTQAQRQKRLADRREIAAAAPPPPPSSHVKAKSLIDMDHANCTMSV